MEFFESEFCPSESSFGLNKIVLLWDILKVSDNK